MNAKSTVLDGIRPLKRRPGITVLIVLTLALGIGVNAGIYSIFHQVLLQKLEVPEPERLVALESPGPRSGSVSTSGTGGSEQVFSYPMYQDLKDAGDGLEGIAAYRGFGVNLAARGQTTSGSGLLVSGNYFEVLDLRPAAGRLFDSNQTYAPGLPRIAVLNHAFWQDRFGRDESVIGETLVVNGRPLEIIGVAPRGFHGVNPFNRVDVYVPVTLLGDLVTGINWSLDNRRSYWLYLFARLAPGISAQQATASISPLYRNIIVDVEAPLQEGASDQFMEQFRARDIELVPAETGQSGTRALARTPLLLLMAVTGLVLLVACVNVTNLLLALAAVERGETAVRQALGAGRRHILVRRLIQLVVLAVLGAAVSLPVALATTRLVLGLIPDLLRGTLVASLDWPVLAMGLCMTAAALLLAGLVPIWQALKSDPMDAIRDQSERTGSGRAAARFRSILVATQIAFALALLVVSGLFLQSLVNISRVNLGLESESVLTFSISPAQNGYTPEQTREMFRTVEQQLSAMPGVISETVSMVPILSGSNWNNNVSVEGFDAGPDTDTDASYNAVGPAFFDALSVPLLAGRVFTYSDVNGRPEVAIVNRAFAEKFGLGDDVVGKRMTMGSGGPLDMEIVGFVADAAYSSVKDEIPPQFYIPIYQTETLGSANFYVRTAAEPAALMAQVRELIHALDADLPVDNLQTLDVVIRQSVFLDRMVGSLAALFAVLATALASVGLFGVLSFMQAQRTGEIGLRAAMGASPARLRRMVFRQTLRLAAIGGAAGLVIAWMLGNLARGLLYELSPLEPQIFLGSAAVLVGVILAASYFPARRTASIHPVEALRYE